MLNYNNNYDFFELSNLLEKSINNSVKKQDIENMKRDINLNIITFLYNVHIIENTNLLKKYYNLII